MMDKKAFMKTMEAFLAIMVVFTFVIFFLPKDTRYTEDQSVFLLRNMERNDVFRNCVLSRNDTCIESSIDEVFQGRYFYTYQIYRYSEPQIQINATEVRVYTWFFAGNQSYYDPMVFKLYYWTTNR
ncbi:MAG: hypothetical protein ACOCUR_03080 [Nanoarchaeota archaeon]